MHTTETLTAQNRVVDRIIADVAAAYKAHCDDKHALEAKINADSRVLWLRRENDAHQTDFAPGMAGGLQLMALMGSSIEARRSRIGNLIRARRAQIAGDRFTVRKLLAGASDARRTEVLRRASEGMKLSADRLGEAMKVLAALSSEGTMITKGMV